MSHTHCRKEGGPAAQTLPPTQTAEDDSQEEAPVLSTSKKSRRLTIGCTGEGWPRSDVPYLRLRGRWLEHAGFAIGRSVQVEVSEGRLLIERVD